MEITEVPQIVGRGAHCSLVLTDPAVSTSHAEFVRRAGSIFVKDLNSTNGTYLNGTRVSGESRVAPGDSVQIGDTFFAVEGNILRELPPQIPRTQIGLRQPVDHATQPIGVPKLPSGPAREEAKEPTYVDSTLSSWLVGLMWASVGVTAAMALSLIYLFVSFEQAFDYFLGSDYGYGFDYFLDESFGFSAFRRWETAGTLYDAIALIWVLLFIAVLALLIIWTYKAYSTSENFKPGKRSWARGWTIGAFFIPLANYVLVTLILGEIHKIVTAPQVNGVVESSWRRRPTPARLILWFVFFGAGTLLAAIGQVVRDQPLTADDVRAGLTLEIIGVGLMCAACFVAIDVLKSMSALLKDPMEHEYA